MAFTFTFKCPTAPAPVTPAPVARSTEFTFSCPPPAPRPVAPRPAPVQQVCSIPFIPSLPSFPAFPILSPVRWSCETSHNTEIKATRIDKDGNPLPPRVRTQKTPMKLARFVASGSYILPRKICKLSMKPASFWLPMTPPTRFSSSSSRNMATTIRPRRDTSSNKSVKAATEEPVKPVQVDGGKLTEKLRSELDDLSAKWEQRPLTTNDIWSTVKTTATVAVGVCKALGWPFVGYLVMEALQR
ncbi:hypothetical protein Dda_8393 [Drechslerella dactyloides]|uniref:Uncharacterized protein n=1 Tax=Drechslerella dactyloides TaxID=74499 RepID=A0AAD6IT66_DREDA|nr:hypothetical protein Dda_8393 [Drechslerella dactyloides]